MIIIKKTLVNNIRLIEIDFIILYLIFFYASITSIQIYINALNGVIVSLIFLIIIIRTVFYTLNNKNIVEIILLIFILVISSLLTVSKVVNTQEFLRFGFPMIFFTLIADTKFIDHTKEFIEIKKNFIFLNIIFISLVLFVSLFDSINYSYEWNSKAFMGYTQSVHTLASYLVLVLLMIVCFINYHKRVYGLALIILPAIISLMTGARTNFFVFAQLLFIILFKEIKNKKVLILLYAVVLTIVIINNINLPIVDKINNQTGDITVVTNGRNNFWTADIEYFFKEDFLHKIVGNGFDSIVGINEKIVDLSIGSHDDFIQIALIAGLLGLTTYIYSIGMFCMQIIRGKAKYLIVFFTSYIFAAVFNGLYGYIPMVVSCLFFYIYFIDDCSKSIFEFKRGKL